MRMRGKKPIFNRDDVFNLDLTLRKVIFAGLTKFKETITDPKYKHWVGYPSALSGDPSLQDMRAVGRDEGEEGVKLWMEIIDKMLYAFNPESEPDIGDYKFKFVCLSEEGGKGESLSGFEVDNEEEYQRYQKDEEEYRRKKQEGNELFGKYFDSLWL